MPEFGRILIIVGIVLVVFGLFVSFVGRLPGDIVVKKENFTFYFPIATSILLSIIISIIFYLISKFF
ncbi:MAG: DUF2905 domain-containing protein [Hydrogenimonas sp.]|nr:DUF2905 domain-containing protein [Hydrogenimonas sp.]